VSKRLANFIRDNPRCCFCGGGAPTTTIDHVPSKQMFLYKHRPKGLESPACKICNNSTGGHEQFAAILARVYQEARTKQESAEIRSLFEAVHRQTPEVLVEMIPSWQQQYDVDRKFGTTVSALNVSGPLVNKSIRIFGTKLVLGLHYHCTGSIVPESGGIAIRWYTNWDRANDRIPGSLFSLLGVPQTLKQGDWSVPDQFEFAWVVTHCKSIAHYVSTFRESFLIAGLVYNDSKQLQESFPSVSFTRPGEWT